MKGKGFPLTSCYSFPQTATASKRVDSQNRLFTPTPRSDPFIRQHDTRNLLITNSLTRLISCRLPYKLGTHWLRSLIVDRHRGKCRIPLVRE